MNKKGYWYSELESEANIEWYEIKEKWNFVIDEHIIILKNNSWEEKIFVLKGYNDVKGWYYEEMKN